MISAIIVAYNEADYIQKIVRELAKQKYSGRYEIILADGGSTDETVSLIEDQHIEIVHCRKGRACQMNDAAKVAIGDILFFVHADMKLHHNTFSTIQEFIAQGYAGGGFKNVFGSHNKKIKKLGRWMNFRLFNTSEQSDKGIFYGDNGIFVSRETFDKLGGFKEIEIMEDYEFSNRMRQEFNVIKIKKIPITVSARRHIKTGFWKT